MNTKLLIMAIAAISLVGCGAYTAERMDSGEPLYQNNFETPFWQEHNTGSITPEQKLADIRDSVISPTFDGILETGFEGENLIQHRLTS